MKDYEVKNWANYKIRQYRRQCEKWRFIAYCSVVLLACYISIFQREFWPLCLLLLVCVANEIRLIVEGKND